ncbi:MAG: Uma2 family endonuclease [Gemmataceae bacterium]
MEQYLAMVERGILTSQDRVELIEGQVVHRMTPRPAHAVCVDLLHEALARVLPPNWHVRTQAPLVLDHSVPEPDACLARGDRRAYRERHPSASEVGLVIEVADTSLIDDRRLKSPLYASAMIPTFWIVNLINQTVEIYGEPRDGSYAVSLARSATEEVPLILDGRELAMISVRDLLP